MKNKLIMGMEAVYIIITVVLIFQVKEQIYYTQVEKGNYREEFRQLNFSEEAAEELRELRKESLSQKEEERKQKWLEQMTAAMLEGRFSLENPKQLSNEGRREFKREPALYEKILKQYSAIFADAKCFPMGEDASGDAFCSYENSWYWSRSFGGERFHEGTDIMTSNNERGYFPIYSMTDGVVEKKGWLKLGGWRLGIRAPKGGYFYYAHLYKYAKGIREGDTVKAGQLIGYAGDSGYGEEEGTVGNFDVHLHMGIYIEEEGEEISVNPYWVLRLLEGEKIRFSHLPD